MARKLVWATAGLTQAAIEKEEPRLRAEAFGMATWSSTPSKERALASQSGPFISEPVSPLPEASAAAAPLPSSNFQWPTGPATGEAVAAVLTSLEKPLSFPVRS